MEIIYDQIVDTLSIRLSHEEIKESNEDKSGIILVYGLKGDLVGIELLNFSKQDINLNHLIRMRPDEIVSSLIK